MANMVLDLWLETAALRMEVYALRAQAEERLNEIERLKREQEGAEASAEQLRVHLAGCLVAAQGGTKCAAGPDAYGWSPAYQAVLDLRIAYDELLKEAKEDREDLEVLRLRHSVLTSQYLRTR